MQKLKGARLTVASPNTFLAETTSAILDFSSFQLARAASFYCAAQRLRTGLGASTVHSSSSKPGACDTSSWSLSCSRKGSLTHFAHSGACRSGRHVEVRASLNEFLQKAKGHGSDGVLRNREQLLLGLHSTAAMEIEFKRQVLLDLSIGDGGAELLARAHGQRPLLFRGKGVWKVGVPQISCSAVGEEVFRSPASAFRCFGAIPKTRSSRRSARAFSEREVHANTRAAAQGPRESGEVGPDPER